MAIPIGVMKGPIFPSFMSNVILIKAAIEAKILTRLIIAARNGSIDPAAHIVNINPIIAINNAVLVNFVFSIIRIYNAIRALIKPKIIPFCSSGVISSILSLKKSITGTL